MGSDRSTAPDPPQAGGLARPSLPTRPCPSPVSGLKPSAFVHHVRHPADVFVSSLAETAEPEINAFLTHLAIKEKVSASTQNQALSALLFLYRHVLGRQVGDLGDVIRARKPRHLPEVMTREEVKPVLRRLSGRGVRSPADTL